MEIIIISFYLDGGKKCKMLYVFEVVLEMIKIKILLHYLMDMEEGDLILYQNENENTKKIFPFNMILNNNKSIDKQHHIVLKDYL